MPVMRRPSQIASGAFDSMRELLWSKRGIRVSFVPCNCLDNVEDFSFFLEALFLGKI